MDETGSFIHGERGLCIRIPRFLFDLAHRSCAKWRAPRVREFIIFPARASHSSRARPPPPPLTSSATSSVGDFQRQLPALARSLKFPFLRFTFNLHCSSPSPPPCVCISSSSPPTHQPPPSHFVSPLLPFPRHPSTSADSAGVQSLMIG